MSVTLQHGKIRRCEVDGIQPLSYFLYTPSGGIQHERVLVTIHGISRNAEEHITSFASLADHYGAAIIAPIFPVTDFPRYQRLGTSAIEGRSDLALDQMLQDAAGEIGVDPSPLRLFGFSGGGQFCHRYALLYPKRVERMVLGAPGWYTFPDTSEIFPYGLRTSPEWPKLRMTPARYLQVPACVMVGENDDIRDQDLNKTRRIDAKQGLNRIERGQRWVNAMNAQANAFKLPCTYRFELVPEATHAFESYFEQPSFASKVFDYLFVDQN